ncbi:MAG TPA: amino acid permease, partial [Kineosporiaceae bacterium]
MAIAVLGFVGFESAVVFAEEARRPRRTLPAAMYASVAVIAALYGVSAWAMTAAAGSDRIVEEARARGTDLVFALVAHRLGPIAVTAGQVLFATSITAAMISFHATTARYVFALGREGVLPAVFGRTTMAGAPKAASLAQTTVGLGVIVAVAVTGTDPLVGLFYTGSV